MRFIVVVSAFLVLSIVFILVRSDDELTNYPPKNKTIVAYGDSLVFGYGATPGNDFVSLLGQNLNRPVINLGVSGDTTLDGVKRMGEVKKHNPGTVLLLLGGNDFLRRTDESVTRENLRTLITTFQQDGAVVVLVGVQGGILFDGRDDMYKSLAEEHGALYVPNVLEDIFGNATLMFDGIHPNDAGYREIANRFTRIFEKYEI
jgi:lysophospholipase L1-like esterase